MRRTYRPPRAANYIPGFSNLDSQAQILAYAFVFGLTQQLLTGLVDKQARSILSTAPGKATGASRPERHTTHQQVALRTKPGEETTSRAPAIGAQPNLD